MIASAGDFKYILARRLIFIPFTLLFYALFMSGPVFISSVVAMPAAQGATFHIALRWLAFVILPGMLIFSGLFGGSMPLPGKKRPRGGQDDPASIQMEAAFGQLPYGVVISRAWGRTCYINPAFERMTGTRRAETDNPFCFLNAQEFALLQTDVSALCRGETAQYCMQVYVNNARGAGMYLKLTGVPIEQQGERRCMTIVEDMTGYVQLQCTLEEQVRHMRDHDVLTGLHNRICFEAQKNIYDQAQPAMSFAVIVADINGLKLINDALGYTCGDQLIITTARLIQGCCPENAVLARTGGDEFSILLPGAGVDTAAALVDAIAAAFLAYNKNNSTLGYDISVSFGLAAKQRERDSMESVTKAAAEHLNSRKLLTRKSSHHSILTYVMATIYARSQETEAHAKRLALLSKRIGERMGLAQGGLDELELFAMLHDIGKIGVDDHILNKPDKLTAEEWIVMRRHPDIGCRIASASPELEHIALLILTHHERWDGGGYPIGLAGEEIPLFARILAVVDAYDAMTEDRVYRKALSRQQAIDEIEKNAGTQFDPYVAAVFIDCIIE